MKRSELRQIIKEELSKLQEGEKVKKTDMKSFVDELSSVMDVSKIKSTASSSKINTTNDGEFKRSVIDYTKGKYDNDPEALVQKLSGILSRKPIKNLSDLLNFILSRGDGQAWRLNNLMKTAMKKSKISGAKLKKLITLYLKVDIDSNIDHQDQFMTFTDALETAVTAEGIMEKSNYWYPWRTKFYDDGNSSWKFHTSDENLKKIEGLFKRYKDTDFPVVTGKKIFDFSPDKNPDITGAKGLDVYPVLWKLWDMGITNHDDENKILQKMNDFVEKMTKKLKITKTVGK